MILLYVDLFHCVEGCVRLQARFLLGWERRRQLEAEVSGGF
jgi:hypothetical protein